MLTLQTPDQNLLNLNSSRIEGTSIELVNPQFKMTASPLPSHQLSLLHDTHLPLIQDAFNLIRLVDAKKMRYIQDWIRFIFWMELKREAWGWDERITSSSFPHWPGCVFVSNKALLHIPPNTLFQEPSIWALAENIYHEAIHQEVNQKILNDNIFTDLFDSKLSPKVFIRWRHDHESRNQNWEIDRCLHAATVYKGLLQWRRMAFDFLLLNPSLQDFPLPLLEKAIDQGSESFQFLIEQLSQEEFGKFLTKNGQVMLEQLKLTDNV